MALAFLAGGATLIYQLVVVRMAMVWFGSESETLAAVVCMSLTGLSAGAYVSGNWGRTGNAARSLAIWLAACAVLQLFFWLVSDAAANAVDSSGLNPSIQKLVFAAIATLPVNFFLGATLPLLTSTIAPLQKSHPFAVVYAAETIGAAIGAILAGFWLIPLWGLKMTQLVAAAITLISALIAFSGFGRFTAAIPPGSDGLHQTRTTSNPLANGILLFAVLLAGVSSMGVEIVWQRFFVLLFGSDTQSFAVVAATYLVGISLGSWLACGWLRCIGQLLAAYAAVLTLVAAATVVATLALIKLTLEPTSFLFANEWISARPVLYRIATAATIMIVPTSLIGLALPLAVSFAGEKAGEFAPAVGKVYAATLIGNVCGLLGTGFVLASGNGLRVTVLLLSGFTLAAAILIFLGYRRIAATRLMIGLATMALVVWIPASMMLIQSKLPLGVNLSHWNLDFYSEGKTNIVSVVSRNSDSTERRMIIDGITIGESRGGVDEKQQMLAHLPFLVTKPGGQPRTVLTIGLGTGILAGALAANPDVDEVICVELSANVIEACQHFSAMNGDVIHHRKVTIENADGIRYIRKADQQFDVIVSDAKSRPGHAGNVAFFTRDYYDLCDRALTDRGIFIQWVSLETAPESVQTIMASFQSAFRYGYLAVSPPDSLYLVGARAQLHFDPDQISQHLRNIKSLHDYGWHSPGDIASMYWVDQKLLKLSTRPLNCFDRPVLELFALRSSGVSPEKHKLANLQWLNRVLESHIDQFNTDPIAPDTDFLTSRRRAALELIDAAIMVTQRPDDWLDRAGEHAKRAFELAPDLHRHRFVADLYRQLAASADRADQPAMKFSALLNVSEMGLATAAEHFFLGSMLNDQQQNSLALDHFYRATRLAPGNVDYQTTFGFSLLDAGKVDQCTKTFQAMLQRRPDHPEALLGLGICKHRNREGDEGWQLIRRALRTKPELQDVLRKYQDF